MKRNGLENNKENLKKINLMKTKMKMKMKEQKKKRRKILKNK
jgi:hypothetical protein